MKKFLIKVLGGYTKEEVDKHLENKLFNHEFNDSAFSQVKDDSLLACARAVGIKYTTDDKFPAVIINLSTKNGISFLNDSNFKKIVANVLSMPISLQNPKEN